MLPIGIVRGSLKRNGLRPRPLDKEMRLPFTLIASLLPDTDLKGLLTMPRVRCFVIGNTADSKKTTIVVFF